MIRTIVGFHTDDLGDWAAELSCLHNQHVRHQPPFQMRPWVLTAEGRAARIGQPIECPRCDRAELPDGLRVLRTAGPFDMDSVPAGLRTAHQVSEGRWGVLRLLEGSVGFWMATEPPIEVHLGEAETQPIPPGVSHHLTVDGPVVLAVDFLGVEARSAPSRTPSDASWSIRDHRSMTVRRGFEMPVSSHKIAIKRAYDPPAAGDGERILVDRLWPRGLRKDAARFDQWRKDLSPSTELRQFYGHRPERFAEFSTRYRAELRNKEAAAAVAELVELNQRRSITLLTASRDLSGSEAAVLATHLQRIIKRRSADSPPGAPGERSRERS